jgi:hypothetical protein
MNEKFQKCLEEGMEINQAQYLKILRPRTSFMIFKKDYSS